MLVVETIAKIRRAFFVQGKSIKAICRELRVSRKVVRKVIRSEATEFRYEREAQPLPKIGLYCSFDLYTGSTFVGHFLRSTSSPSRTRKAFELIFIFILPMVLGACRVRLHC